MELKTLIFTITITISIITPLPSLSFQLPSNKTPTLASSQYQTLTRNTIQQQFLQPHNILRAKLRLPPLKWSNKLARYATRWARTRRGDCNLIHSGGPYGENLFWGSGKGWTPGNAVVAWASERKYYDRKTYRCKANGDCLHYTQLVWKKSLRVGCAIVFCKSGDTFIICNYDPPGNIVGQPPF
ncbi:hypothetical protein Rs2_13048 [Raphanus sativus]|uniref:Pathogenesis-related protein PRB1-3 n=1 Tax=Raphanus sativus TaxID=3726 RepID=A0A6J0ND12_RAPSA|nr:pathogenesis-related protein PRB1-3 [Raphanus sativus]KAJ4899097.1 hypothetical protein Rs2_13048 [Raphanus sativus]